VRRRGKAGFVANAAARVEAHRPRGQVRLQVTGEVARGAVVARNDEGRTLRVQVEQRGQQVGAHARGGEDPLWFPLRRIGETPNCGLSLGEWQ
jgi:hypothetical protein